MIIQKYAIQSLVSVLLIFVAGSALANVNAIDYPAMPPGATGTSITLPGTGTEPLVGLSECQQLAQPGEECDEDYSLFYVGTWAMAEGTELTLNYTPRGGNSVSAPVTIGADGVARSGSIPSRGASSGPDIGYPSLYVRGGSAEVDSLDTELGVKVNFDLGTDVGLLRIGGTYSGDSFGIGGSSPVGTDSTRIFWNISTLDADARGGELFPYTSLGVGESFGYLYHERAGDPVTGSTGFSNDFLDFSVAYDADFESTDADFAIGSDRINDMDCTWTPMLGFRWSDSEHQLNSHLEFLTDDLFAEPNTISSSSEQKIDESLFGIGVGVAGHSPRGHYPVEISYRTMLYLDFVDHDLRSYQRNICDLCGSPDNDFAVETRSSSDDTGLGGLVELNVFYPIGERASIGVYGSLDYRSNAPRLRNPVTEADLETGPVLQNQSSTTVQYGARFAYSF